MKRFSIFVLAVFLLFSTGCSSTANLFSNYRPIEQIKLVHTLGFDTHEDGLELSVCGGEKDNQGLIRLASSGKNISDALANVQQYSGKEELYYAHTRYILVGEDYARQGLGEIMEYLESASQLRSDLPLFIVRNGTAKDMLMKVGGEKDGIFQIMESVIRDCKQRGDSFPFTCGDVATFSEEYGSALACVLTAKKTKEIDPEAKDDELTPVVSGYAVIKQEKLMGYISEDTAKGINLLINELGTGDVTITHNGKPFSLRIKKADTSLIPVFGDAGTITELTIEMKIQATLEEAEQKSDQDLEKLSQSFSKTVEQWIDEILQTMRSTNADFLGFGPRIALKHARQWHLNPIDWENQLSTLPMHTNIYCTVNLGENEPRR